MASFRDLRPWDRVLLVVLATVGLYAFVLVVAGLTLGDSVFEWLGFGPDDGQVTEDAPREYLRLVYGILGAVIVGWMITIAALVLGPLHRREWWAWTTITVSATTWFVLDTGLSLVLGYEGHAAFNLLFAAGLAIPLTMIRRELR